MTNGEFVGHPVHIVAFESAHLFGKRNFITTLDSFLFLFLSHTLLTCPRTFRESTFTFPSVAGLFPFAFFIGRSLGIRNREN